jgi:hypothetical protein
VGAASGRVAGVGAALAAGWAKQRVALAVPPKPRPTLLAGMLGGGHGRGALGAGEGELGGRGEAGHGQLLLLVGVGSESGCEEGWGLVGAAPTLPGSVPCDFPGRREPG